MKTTRRTRRERLAAVILRRITARECAYCRIADEVTMRHVSERAADAALRWFAAERRKETK